MIENLAQTIYYLTTDLLTQLIIAVVFPSLAIGIAIKFMRNLDRD